MIEFEITGKPTAQERPIRTGNGWFDRNKSKKAKKIVFQIATMARIKAAATVSIAPFSVSLIFHGANPLCDIDNLIKLVLDGLKGVFWEDDRQVVRIEANKLKCEKGKERTEVSIIQLPMRG